MPELQAEYDTYKGQGFSVLAPDYADSSDTIKNYFSTNGFTMTPLVDTGGSVFSTYSVSRTPTVIIVDKSGVIQYRREGWSKSEVDSKIKQLLTQ